MVTYQKSWTHEGRPELDGRGRHEAPDGPWMSEPDKVHWIDEASDMDCLAVRNRLGAWCGYVAVPPGHPLHGADYDDVEVEVHGGLTFASNCVESDEGEGHGICHTPLPGRPADVWWLGFDCAHLGDLIPYEAAAVGRPRELLEGETYRDLEYVQAETASLAAQLAGASA